MDITRSIWLSLSEIVCHVPRVVQVSRAVHVPRAVQVNIRICQVPSIRYCCLLGSNRLSFGCSRRCGICLFFFFDNGQPWQPLLQFNAGKLIWFHFENWTNCGMCECVGLCGNASQHESYRYFGWLIAYTYGSMQATALHAQAGIIVTAGVNSSRLPNEPINDRTAYGVQANENMWPKIILNPKPNVHILHSCRQQWKICITCNKEKANGDCRFGYSNFSRWCARIRSQRFHIHFLGLRP